MDQINKPILNSPSGPSTCLSLNDSILGFIVPSLLSVIRVMTQTQLIFSVFKTLSC